MRKAHGYGLWHPTLCAVVQAAAGEHLSVLTFFGWSEADVIWTPSLASGAPHYTGLGFTLFPS